MREIKFRAWHKGIMLRDGIDAIMMSDYCVPGIDAGVGDGFTIPHDDAILMQYTGLKDNNGKEIYEGDMLLPAYNEDEYFEVIFKDGMFRERRRLPGFPANDAYIMDGSFLRSGRLEVIGNIYENKELL